MPIKMDKAIEILEINAKEGHKTMHPDVKQSLSLAISNMRTTQYIRRGGTWDLHALFPDELPWDEQ